MEDRLGFLFDEAAIRGLQQLFGTADPLPFHILSLLGDTWGILLVLGLALWRYGRGPAYGVAAAAAITAPLWLGLTALFSVERPSGSGIVVFETLEAGAFPSGHVFHAVVAWGVLAARTSFPGWPVAVVALATGVARIYLGVHFPADVLASLLLGPFVVRAFHRSWDRIRGRRLPLPPWLWIAALVLVLAVLTATLLGPLEPGRVRRWEIVGMIYGGALALLLHVTRRPPTPVPLPGRAAMAVAFAGLALLALGTRATAEALLWLGALGTGLGVVWIFVVIPALFGGSGTRAGGSVRAGA